MPNRSIRWSFNPKAVLLLASLMHGAVPALAETELPPNDMHSEAQLTLHTRDRVVQSLQRPTANEAAYEVIGYQKPEVPEPVVIPVVQAQPDRTYIVEPEPPARPEPLDTWLIYETRSKAVSPEDAIYAQIERDYELRPCLPGFDCPLDKMELPAWPETETQNQDRIAEPLFQSETITPFNPIPELNDLPFNTD